MQGVDSDKTIIYQWVSDDRFLLIFGGSLCYNIKMEIDSKIWDNAIKQKHKEWIDFYLLPECRSIALVANQFSTSVQSVHYVLKKYKIGIKKETRRQYKSPFARQYNRVGY